MFFEANKPTFYPSTSTNKPAFYPSTSTDKPRLDPMAATFAMPVPQLTTSPTQYASFFMHRSSQPVSPSQSNPASPHSVSPTSPRTTRQLPPPSARSQQLRPPKSPLYMPAVLRKTETPRRAKASPPQSLHGSIDEGDFKILTRRNTGDSGKFVGLGSVEERECSTEGLGKVTAHPTRRHWKPDSASNVCDDASCTQSFNAFRRRHHCRRCGNIFCDQHSPFQIPLDQDANYHPEGFASRACLHCANAYGSWTVARSSRSSSETSEDSPTSLRSPVDCSAAPRRNGLFAAVGGRAESLAASVPRDWNWSTF